MADSADVGKQAFPGSRPKPCMKFFSTSGCQFGESCHFLHYVPGGLTSLGLAPATSLSTAPTATLQQKQSALVGDPSTSVSGYKTKLCNRFNTPEGCRFGDRCHFAHGESDLRPPSSQARGHRRPMPDGPPANFSPVFGNTGFGFPNPNGYSAPLGNPSTFPAQRFAGPNQIAGASNNDGSVGYPAGSVNENVPVY